MLQLLFNLSLCTIRITLVKIHSFWNLRSLHVLFAMYATCLLGYGLVPLKIWENLQFKLLWLQLHLYLPADVLQFSSDHSACGNQSGGERPVHSWFWL